MNLYVRLVWLLLRGAWVARQPLLEPSVLHTRAWPTDIDINLHLTNSRYLALMDLGRTHLIQQAGMFRALLRKGWLPVAGAVELTFVRPIPPLARFDLVTRLLGWDEKYWYIEQRFVQAGRTCATALVRGVFVGQGRTVAVGDVVALAGLEGPSPPLPDAVEAWKTLLATKRREAAAA